MLRIVRRKPFPSINSAIGPYGHGIRKQYTHRRTHASAARILARGLRETLHGFRKGSMSLRARQARKSQRGYL